MKPCIFFIEVTEIIFKTNDNVLNKIEFCVKKIGRFIYPQFEGGRS